MSSRSGKSRRRTPTSSGHSADDRVSTETIKRAKNRNSNSKRGVDRLDATNGCPNSTDSSESDSDSENASQQATPSPEVHHDLVCASDSTNSAKGGTTSLSHGKKIYRYNGTSAVYEGQFKNGKRHGFGKLIWDDGGEYEGEWKDGKPNGRGTMRYANGDVYKGQFKNDKRHGKGTYKWLKGDVYTGNWKDDKRHGMGTRKYTKGDVYYGEWKDGKRHGDGSFSFEQSRSIPPSKFSLLRLNPAKQLLARIWPSPRQNERSRRWPLHHGLTRGSSSVHRSKPDSI